MIRSMITAAAAVCTILVSTGKLRAQIDPVLPLVAADRPAAPAVAGHHVRCGTLAYNDGREVEALANTARRNPELYRRILERSKEARTRGIAAAVDSFHTFTVRNNITNEFSEVRARMVFMGRRARIWVDVADTGRMRKTTIPLMARGLDSTTPGNTALGIIDNDEKVFGLPPANRFDGATPTVEDFLLTDIPDAFDGESILGFFSPWDQTDNDGSNRMNLLYIDSREGLGSQTTGDVLGVLSTLAHEYQHLIHFHMNPESELFFNEGCSELASTLCGYFDRTDVKFLTNTNVEMLRWSVADPVDIEADYQRALTFMRYLYEQYDEAFITRLVVTRSTGMQRVAHALAAVGRAPDWQAAVKGFYVACYVRHNYADPRYVFKKALSTSAANVTNTFANNVPPNGEMVVEQYGAVYNLYSFTTPAGIKVRFQAGQPYAVMAVAFRNNLVSEVRELRNGADNLIGETVGCSKIVFVVINLGVTVQSIQWTATQLTSGVALREETSGEPELEALRPNPASGPVAINYRSAGSTGVTIGVYDMQGRLVRTLLDGERALPAAGSVVLDPTELPNGIYVVRMREGARIWSRRLVVQR